jgi:hypothetical protein
MVHMIEDVSAATFQRRIPVPLHFRESIIYGFRQSSIDA